MLRCTTRISRDENLTFDMRYPILLRNSSYFTKLIILHFHQEIYHCGVESTLNRIRNFYWIIKGRQTVKIILRNCVICKIIQKKPPLKEETPALPLFRVKLNYCFENVGLDYAGPMYYKDLSENKMQKCYILLFTCSVSRCIHLELTTSLGLNPLKLALRRFVSRRGIPRLFVSDNFQTFRSKEIKNFVSSLFINWNFILERSPWWGGFYERLIGIVKTCIKKVVSRARLSYEELNTIIIEIEGVLNTRPLTHINEDDYSESLTPNHLLYGRSLVHSSSHNNFKELNTADECREIVQHYKRVFEHFKKRFITEYLTALQERHYYQQDKHKSKNNIQIGDVVLVKENKKNRLSWKKGKIINLLKGKDDIVRGVQLVMYQPNLNKTVNINRPIQLIVPLEIQEHSKLPSEPAPDENRTQGVAEKNADLFRRLNQR